MALHPSPFTVNLTLHRESIKPGISFTIPEERIIFLTLPFDGDIEETHMGQKKIRKCSAHLLWGQFHAIGAEKRRMSNKPQDAKHSTAGTLTADRRPSHMLRSTQTLLTWPSLTDRTVRWKATLFNQSWKHSPPVTLKMQITSLTSHRLITTWARHRELNRPTLTISDAARGQDTFDCCASSSARNCHKKKRSCVGQMFYQKCVGKNENPAKWLLNYNNA